MSFNSASKYEERLEAGLEAVGVFSRLIIGEIYGYCCILVSFAETRLKPKLTASNVKQLEDKETRQICPHLSTDSGLSTMHEGVEVINFHLHAFSNI